MLKRRRKEKNTAPFLALSFPCEAGKGSTSPFPAPLALNRNQREACEAGLLFLLRSLLRKQKEGKLLLILAFLLFLLPASCCSPPCAWNSEGFPPLPCSAPPKEGARAWFPFPCASLGGGSCFFCFLHAPQAPQCG
uniref:hypothetical protein 21 n=1 Tax=Moniliophthora perniciosa TaxID=153609 RepID=UPI0000242356|nr:hypothetical protein 21 [Moniliophthora perniciosa]AAQ74311.1 hypothetical protein 21 [Moniliophthora perniciosa]